MTKTVKLDKSGRFLVPKAMRDQLRLEPGQHLAVHVGDRGLILRPINSSLKPLEEDATS
jgi:AbrB family looped-hinge helix DNA binding protein